MNAHDNREVEIKFVVHDTEALVRSVQNAGLREKTPSTFESNSLYDDAAGNLRRAGEVLRLRLYNDRWRLTHKTRGTAEKHKVRVEHETAVANGEEMNAILAALGYHPSFRYEKYRAEWTDGAGELVIDRTPIGDIAELEGPPEWIDRIAGLIGLSEDDYITVSYVELFHQWKQRTGSAALHMTFDECGIPRP
jgi:adenylate cyclase class 2